MKKQQRGGRANRINSLIRQLVAEEFIRSSDSIINSLTISHVDTSPDMKRSTVFVTNMDKNRSEVLNSLVKSRVKIQKNIGKQLDMKFTPKLFFEIDPVTENAEKLNNLLNTISNE